MMSGLQQIPYDINIDVHQIVQATQMQAPVDSGPSLRGHQDKTLVIHFVTYLVIYP